MGVISSQITSLTIVYSIVFQVQIKEKIKASRHWPLCGEFTDDRWIPRTMASNAENVLIWWRHHEQRNLEHDVDVTQASWCLKSPTIWPFAQHVFVCLWQKLISVKVLVKSKVPGYGMISSIWLIIICIFKIALERLSRITLLKHIDKFVTSYNILYACFATVMISYLCASCCIIRL